ncbi:MAG: hypothetical protein ACI4O7_09170 [Aristaeellaceae bacterium]
MPQSRTEYWNSIQGLRTTNAHIRDAAAYFDAHYEETPEVVQHFFDSFPLTNEEFITFIAISRLKGLQHSSGNGSNAMMDQIRSEYRNTPWKFVEEFLQNADDCAYDGIPEIRIIVDERQSAIEFVYNERGFTRKDIWSLTQFNDSTKPGSRDLTFSARHDGLFYNEKTGRKGIGFKSVFALDADNVIVHICSNGFGFRLDNVISPIVPVWEPPAADDGKTHIRIELVNPRFSLREIYPNFRKLFCIDDRQHLFSDSPLLFMHRLRSISVEHRTRQGNESFAVSLEQSAEQTEYGRPILENNGILSGIARKGRLCSSEKAQISLTFRENGGEKAVISCLRYSETLKVNGCWQVFSVLAPIIRDRNTWEGGSLFRTFPMLDHQYPIPFAMNLPYELNMARKGISYSNAMEENKLVSEAMFRESGVFRTFLKHLRACDGIAMDQYFPERPAVIFDDTDNRRRDGHYYVPLVNLSDILNTEELFPLARNEKQYVSRARLACVDERFLDWPEPRKLLEKLCGESFVDRLVARRYLSCDLLKRQRTGLIDARFVTRMNDYLQYLEKRLGCGSAEYAQFLSSSLYPFLCENEHAIDRFDGFRQLAMYLFRVDDGSKTVMVREHVSPDVIWMDQTDQPSFHHYRTLASSGTDLSMLLRRHQPVDVKHAPELFSARAVQDRANSADSLEAVLQVLEETAYYKGDLKGIVFPALNRYALLPDACAEKNPLRDAGLLEIIPRRGADRMARSLRIDMNALPSAARALGLRAADDFFDEAGSFLRFNSLTRTYLSADHSQQAQDFIQLLGRKLTRCGKKLDTSYGELRHAPVAIQLYLLREPRWIVQEAYGQLCQSILDDQAVWQKQCNESTELLLRAVSRVSGSHLQSMSRISLDMQYLVEHRLGSHVKRAVEKFGFDKCLHIVNNGYFRQVSGQEIAEILMATELDEARKREEAAKTFYGGDLSACHDDGKPIDFLLATLDNAVYLHETAQCDIRETFSYKYLQCQFDAEKTRRFNQVRMQTQPVYERLILPALERTNNDWDAAFELLAQDFAGMPKEDAINVIARFRMQSYARSLGNASQSHEQEIAEDYRQAPWKFAYEFLQNTDDCSFPANVVPEIAISVSRESNSVSFEYNEFGFTLEDIITITSFGTSQKASELESLKSLPLSGLFDREKTGRKGRGFKSVFALPGKNITVHVFSNGFSFRFEKRLGEIIPIWEKPASPVCMGTRITVEGFSAQSINTMYVRLLDTLFVNDQTQLFAASPLLFLRHLRRISLTDGTHTHSFDMQEERADYPNDAFPASGMIVSGIRKNGLYKASQTAFITIRQKATGRKTVQIKAVRASFMKDIDGRTRLLSIMAPIITRDAGLRYTDGALYHTLPAEHHRLPVPLAVNSAFELNSGRSALADERNTLNSELLRWLFRDCLPQTLTLLRDQPGIAMEAYIPGRSNPSNRLFAGMLNVAPVDIRQQIRGLPLLRLQSGQGYVSCEKANVLPAACYAWPLPVRLAQIFDQTSEDRLAAQEFRGAVDDLRPVQIINDRFCTHINAYLDAIEATGQNAVWTFLSEKLYACITQRFDDLRRAFVGHEDALGAMRIFAYTDVHGKARREAAQENSIWLIDCPERFKSYHECRVFQSAPVRYDLQRDTWMLRLLHTEAYGTFQAGEGFAADNWDSAVHWLEIGLYYERADACQLSFLHDCVLCESLSPAQNIFRKACALTRDKGILQRIISEQDVAQIVRDLAPHMPIQTEDVVRAIRQRGLRKDDDFFESMPGRIALSVPTLAVLRSAGFDRDAAQEYVQTVSSAFHRRYDRALLSVSYEELKRCSPVVFTCIFRSELLQGEALSHMARRFFDDAEILRQDKAADYAEAYLYCMSLAQEPMGVVRSISIGLSEIRRCRLGVCVQRAQLSAHCPGSTLRIERDVPCRPYESREIKRSLHWLSDDTMKDADIARYDYFTADIADAFGDADTARYVFDQNTVIVHAQHPQEHILDFVRRKYAAARDTQLLVGLIRIASAQYELQENWRGSKKDYVARLAAFRAETDKYISFLCPGYQQRVNETTGDSAYSLIAELLQNINDCRDEQAHPARELDITLDDQGQTMTLTYDEQGFQFADVYSITAYGQSTKHDEREGEKGLGFKKVFTVFSQVDIYSNGFSFRLTADKPTIPRWIEPGSAAAPIPAAGKTTMVFRFAEPEKHLRRMQNIWTDAMTHAGSASLLLGLSRIASYSLHTPDGTRTLAREQILSLFYCKTLPLLETYGELHRTSAASPLQALTAALRTRTKCAVMSTTEFDHYIRQLTVTVYIPRKAQGNGVYYSTLPTAMSSGCAMFIDLPLELSTGRNEVMADSSFNHAVMQMLYDPTGARCSVMSCLLACIAREHPACRLYEAIPQVNAYLDAAAAFNRDARGAIREELYQLPIVHTWHDNALLPVSRIFTAPGIVYDYMHEVKERTEVYDAWLRAQHPEAVPADCALASRQDGVQRTLKQFAQGVGIPDGRYPLSGPANQYVIEYFEAEYGTEEVK